MTERYTESRYLDDWREEISAGASGRTPALSIDCNGKASIKTISAPTDSPDYKPQKGEE